MMTGADGEFRIVWRERKAWLHEIFDVSADKRPRMLARGGHIGGVIRSQLIIGRKLDRLRGKCRVDSRHTPVAALEDGAADACSQIVLALYDANDVGNLVNGQVERTKRMRRGESKRAGGRVKAIVLVNCGDPYARVE